MNLDKLVVSTAEQIIKFKIDMKTINEISTSRNDSENFWSSICFAYLGHCNFKYSFPVKIKIWWKRNFEKFREKTIAYVEINNNNTDHVNRF